MKIKQISTEEIGKTNYHVIDTINHKNKITELFLVYLQRMENDMCPDNFLDMIINPYNYIGKDILLDKIISNTITNKEYNEVIRKMTEILILHDNSKIIDQEEFNLYKEVVYKLEGLEHGTPEHKEAIKELDKGFQVHAYNNGHHAEHYTYGVYDFSLYYLLEMLLDWSAASLCRGFKFRLSSIKNKEKSINLTPYVTELLIKNIYYILNYTDIENDI